ncbi:MAG: undecaprenyl-phosphate glucose phosphotransferase [Hyphomicrobiales bacterium]|nr:undecaprenyl-phosphate glucose phosphotransferase [Hyphomicrobiales bacterium]
MAQSITSKSEDKRGSVELSDRAEQVASQFAQNPISPFVLAAVLRIIEFFAVVIIGLGVYFAYVVPMDGVKTSYLLTCFVGGILALVALQAADSYQITSLRTNVLQIGRVLGAWAAIFAVLALVAFFTRVSEFYSRVWFGGWFMLGAVFFVVFRSFVAAMVRRWAREGRLERRAVIVGGGKNAEDLIISLEAQADNDIRICGIFDDRQGDRSPPMVAGYPKLGTIAELVEFGRRARIDMLIVSLPISAESRVLSLLKKVWVLPVDIRLSAHTNKLRFRSRSYSYVGAVPFLDVFDKPIADWDSVMKRGFDILFSSLALVFLSPIMLAAAIAIKLESKGPVIFRQKRFGFNNEVIEVLKFRSMYTEMTDHDAKKVVTKNDPRVTKVGRFIRKTSIDELPQLVNVLKGELSLVGPRPHAVNAHTENQLWDEVVDGYFGRHKVKPGVTGWAQINGWRGEVDNEEKIRCRVEHDLYYIENWSVLFDLYILMITPFKLLNTENAY